MEKDEKIKAILIIVLSVAILAIFGMWGRLALLIVALLGILTCFLLEEFIQTIFGLSLGVASIAIAAFATFIFLVLEINPSTVTLIITLGMVFLGFVFSMVSKVGWIGFRLSGIIVVFWVSSFLCLSGEIPHKLAFYPRWGFIIGILLRTLFECREIESSYKSKKIIREGKKAEKWLKAKGLL